MKTYDCTLVYCNNNEESFKIYAKNDSEARIKAFLRCSHVPDQSFRVEIYYKTVRVSDISTRKHSTAEDVSAPSSKGDQNEI